MPDDSNNQNPWNIEKVLSILGNRWFIRSVFFAIFMFCVVQLLRFEQFLLGNGPEVQRPEAVAGLLPVGHFTSLFAWIKGGGWDTLLPAGLVIIMGAVIVSLFFKRGFCGYICPLGTFWGFAALAGRKAFGKNFILPKWIDYIGRAFQILLAFAALVILAGVSLQEALWFRELPYMWIADLKIIHSFVNPPFLIAVLLCLGATFFLSPVWCRYLCPLGGLYGTIGMASPCAINRDEETCIDCKKCAHACPVGLDPSTVTVVRSNVCDGCMDCVHACPVEECLEPKIAGRIVMKPWMWGIGIVVVWLLIYGTALAMGQWHSTLTYDQYQTGLQVLYTETKGFF